MVGLTLKSAFQFKRKTSDKAYSGGGRLSRLASVANELHPQDYDALQPLLTLLNIQGQKCYASEAISGVFIAKVEDRGFVPVSKFSLIGTTLRLYVRSNDLNNAVEDVIDIDIKLLWDHRISKNGDNYLLSFYSNNDISLVSLNEKDVLQVSKLISLAQFEYGSLFKSLTATIISSVGLKIPDIHVILNNNFSFKDWCYIYLNNEWVKVWCHVDKRKKPGDPKGKAKVKFYRDDKSTSKKNLICFISDLDPVEEVFLTTEPFIPTKVDGINWDLERLKTLSHSGLNTSDALDTFMENLDTVSVLGTVNWVNPESASDSPRSSRSRSSSFAWVSKSPRARGLSMSDTKLQSRSAKASSTTLTDLPTSPVSKSHKRVMSEASMSSTTPIDLDDASFESSSERFLFKPIPHAGVHHLETIIRFLLPIYDCLQLYGRPASFRNGREDYHSLTFGLPKLPSVDFFSKGELENLFSESAMDFDLNTLDRWKYFKSALRECYEDESRSSTQSFRTLSSSLNNSLVRIPLSPSSNSKPQYSTTYNNSNDSPPIL